MPWRVVAGSQYTDAAVSVYVKVAALAVRPEGCTARVETLAAYLGMSKSAVERGLRQLTRPDVVDQVVEVPTIRRTLPGGTGTSALRTVRPLERGELFVWVPVRAAEALTPRLLRAYAVLAWAVARSIPMAAADLGEMLYHHSGPRAGEHLGERTARRIVGELAAAGWITVDHRAGGQGRHAYTAHNAPLHAVPSQAAPDTHDGSGPDDQDGSLASKEDLSTDRREPGALGIRRRRDTGSRAVENPGIASGAYTGPGLLLSSRVFDVLTPLAHLLPDVRPYVLREIAREVGRQLDAGTRSERLRARLTHRYASTEPVRDPGRWILGAALPRRGCGLTACESGVIWHTGDPCQVCTDIRLQAPGPAPSPLHRPSAAVSPPRPAAWCACPDCRPPAARAAGAP